MAATLFFLLLIATYSANSTNIVDSSGDIGPGEVYTKQEQFNNDLLRRVNQLELQQVEDRGNIFKLQTENAKLREILADHVHKADLEKNNIKEDEAQHTDSKRSFTLAPPTVQSKPAFTATLAGYERRNLSLFSMIVFENVLTNIGGGYSNVTGYFTAPNDGTYFFMATIMSCTGGYVEMNIATSRAVLGSLHVEDQSGHEMSSSGATVVLKKGDRVAVMHNYNEGDCIYGTFSSFSGFQI